MVIVAFGLPIAYAAAFVWSAPVLDALHRLGWMQAATAIGAGAIGGTIVAMCLAFDQQGSLFRVRMPLSASAVLGAIAGMACWWVGQGKMRHPPKSSGGGRGASPSFRIVPARR